MKKILKLITIAILSFTIGVGIGLGVIYSVYESAKVPSIGEITDVRNVDKNLFEIFTIISHIFIQLIVQRAGLDPQQRSRLGLDVVCFIHRPGNKIAFHLV